MQQKVGRSSGFTLVEVLIALVVLSIGMLGIAALYLDSLRASRAALSRTQAVTLAGDIGERIRANREPANAYHCAGVCDIDNPPGLNAVADEDIVAWLDAMAISLPAGSTGALSYTAGGANLPDSYAVVVSWPEIGYEDPLSVVLRIEI
jgi:type IV pilus assembly protein PilV